jgi:hypothetical protein
LGHAFELVVDGLYVGKSKANFISRYLHGEINCSYPLLKMPTDLKDNRNGLRSNTGPEGYWQFHSGSNDMMEIFGDMFVAWTYDNPNGQRGWATGKDGNLASDANARSNVMNTDMPYFIDAARWQSYLEGRWQ